MSAKWLRGSFLLILILGMSWWLCAKVGLIQHCLIKNQIHKLSGSDRKKAESEFYARGKADYIFAGTLAKIMKTGIYQ